MKKSPIATISCFARCHCSRRFYAPSARWRCRPGPLLLSLCVLLLTTPSAPLLAHAVVTESSLHSQPVQAQTRTSVVLSFNSNIELSLSQVFLVSRGDVHQPVPVTQGRQPGQIVVELPPLDRGEYALRYKVFAADGHLTEDVIHFAVGEEVHR